MRSGCDDQRRVPSRKPPWIGGFTKRPVHADDSGLPVRVRWAARSVCGVGVPKLASCLQIVDFSVRAPSFGTPQVAAIMPQLARLTVKHGVDDNLATLKQILEAASR